MSERLRAGFLLLWALISALAAGHPVLADEPSRAGLVIVHGDGTVVTRCVEFAEDSLSGDALLTAAGLDVGLDVTAMGTTICRLDGEGCGVPQEACFCRCLSSPCIYWSYWRLEDTGWTYSSLGVGSTKVKDGDVEAWVWSEGVVGREAELQPPAFSFAELCPAALTAEPATAVDAGPAAVVTVPASPPASSRSGSVRTLAAVAAVMGVPLLIAALWFGAQALRRPS